MCERKGGIGNKFEPVIVRIGAGNGEVGDVDSLQTYIPLRMFAAVDGGALSLSKLSWSFAAVLMVYNLLQFLNFQLMHWP